MDARDLKAQGNGASVSEGVEDTLSMQHLRSAAWKRTSPTEPMSSFSRANVDPKPVSDALVGPPPTPPLDASAQSLLTTLKASQLPRSTDSELQFSPIVPPPLAAARIMPTTLTRMPGTQSGGSLLVPIVPPPPPTPPPAARPGPGFHCTPMQQKAFTRTCNPGSLLALILPPPPPYTAPAPLAAPAPAQAPRSSVDGNVIVDQTANTDYLSTRGSAVEGQELLTTREDLRMVVGAGNLPSSTIVLACADSSSGRSPLRALALPPPVRALNPSRQLQTLAPTSAAASESPVVMPGAAYARRKPSAIFSSHSLPGCVPGTPVRATAEQPQPTHGWCDTNPSRLLATANAPVPMSTSQENTVSAPFKYNASPQPPVPVVARPARTTPGSSSLAQACSTDDEKASPFASFLPLAPPTPNPKLFSLAGPAWSCSVSLCSSASAATFSSKASSSVLSPSSSPALSLCSFCPSSQVTSPTPPDVPKSAPASSPLPPLHCDPSVSCTLAVLPTAPCTQTALYGLLRFLSHVLVRLVVLIFYAGLLYGDVAAWQSRRAAAAAATRWHAAMYGRNVGSDMMWQAPPPPVLESLLASLFGVGGAARQVPRFPWPHVLLAAPCLVALLLGLGTEVAALLLAGRLVLCLGLCHWRGILLFWRPEYVKTIQLKELGAAGATLILAARQLSAVLAAASSGCPEAASETHLQRYPAAEASCDDGTRKAVQPSLPPMPPRKHQDREEDEQKQLRLLQRHQEQQDLLQRLRERQLALQRLGLAGRLAPVQRLLLRLGLILMVPLFAFYGCVQLAHVRELQGTGTLSEALSELLLAGYRWVPRGDGAVHTYWLPLQFAMALPYYMGLRHQWLATALGLAVAAEGALCWRFWNCIRLAAWNYSFYVCRHFTANLVISLGLLLASPNAHEHGPGGRSALSAAACSK